MTHRTARKLARQLGLSISDDGLAFTVCGSQLVNGAPAPAWLAALNGNPVEDVEAAATGLSKLRQAIIDNTRGDLFWIGGILLAELEKETGFSGDGEQAREEK